jgi:hypothetical protein
LAAGLMVLVILALIAIYTTREAWPWFSAEGLGIFSDNWDPAHQHFGAGHLHDVQDESHANRRHAPSAAIASRAVALHV